MSNNKQVIKLYSEEQVKYFFECGRNYQNNAEITFQVAKEEMPTAPIELPSDEEIHDKSIKYYTNITASFYFELGAKWMRDRIGGNK